MYLLVQTGLEKAIYSKRSGCFPRQPLGISGGRLPDAVQELLRARKGSEHIQKVTSDALGLIGWARSYGTGSSADLPLSPAAAG